MERATSPTKFANALNYGQSLALIFNKIMNTPEQNTDQQANYNFPMLPKDAPWDERVLHFLKELPAWLIIFFLVTFLVIVWLYTASAQIESYIGQGLAALLTAVVTNRNRQQQNVTDNSVTTDTIKTDQVTTDTINDSTFNVAKMDKPKAKI